MLFIGVESPLAALLIANLTKHLPATHTERRNTESGKRIIIAVLSEGVCWVELIPILT
jgi:hypothetical protein